ncbi:class I adenylate-forming enzyme family protein [Novosphingobium sp.]|uniref:class I adenylate-forming enzyme family protein n=1 Tax=Novosphingobium sp. TaxID=1874826 RepID=UPI00286AFF44|nr:class I adenylate-forming enzyme family protein [Novosphingobium sp.]
MGESFAEWIPAGWPAMTLPECEEALCVPGSKFEIETVEIRGVPTRVWKAAPPHLAALVEAARGHGAQMFTIYEDERVSYEAWYRAVATLAAHFEELGVRKGDRIALAMRNLPEWPVVFFAAVTLGAICVPLNAWWTGQELSYGLNDSGAKLLVCDAERLDRILPHRAELPGLEHILVSRLAVARPDTTRLEDVIGQSAAWAGLPERTLPTVALEADDPATILYTSGTTGNPKGALGTHRNFLSNIFSSGYTAARSVLRRGEALPDPEPRTILTVIPLFHATACSATMMGALAAGHTMIFMYKWDPVKAFQIIEREKVHATGGVPTIAWQLIEHPERENYDLSSLESIGYGGAPSAPELVRKIRETFGALPGNGWGMTETTATVTQHGAEDYLFRPDSCGPPVPVSRLKLTDPEGQEVPQGEVGELWANGPMIVAEYWNNPKASAETFIDGWVRTGDLAWIDEEGFCHIADRAKDIVIRGGENIYSSEVENVLYEHPAVMDAAIVGIPHRTLGEEPAAVVYLKPGTEASEAELQALVGERLARFKVPVKVLFYPETLPRNANGKILKKELRGLFA